LIAGAVSLCISKPWSSDKPLPCPTLYIFIM
jgi:hypothetical protein